MATDWPNSRSPIVIPPGHSRYTINDMGCSQSSTVAPVALSPPIHVPHPHAHAHAHAASPHSSSPRPLSHASPRHADAHHKANKLKDAPVIHINSSPYKPVASLIPLTIPFPASPTLTPLLSPSLREDKVAPMKSKYEFLDLLGYGHFGKVYRVIERCSGVSYACKVIERSRLASGRAALKGEVEILMRLKGHPNIVKLHEYQEEENKTYIVLELCDSGDLFGQISVQGRYSEAEAVRYCRQLAEALQHLHKRGIVHRDLKPENILLHRTNDKSPPVLKVADFGLSALTAGRADGKLRTVCGSMPYSAPEVILRRPYDHTIDNWSLGILMFILLSGYHPFDFGDSPEPEVVKRIVACKLEFNDPLWDNISDQAKAIIKRLVVFEPTQRMSLSEFLSCPWLSGGAPDRPLPHVAERLQALASAQRIRAIVMAKIASSRFKASISRSSTPRLTGLRGADALGLDSLTSFSNESFNQPNMPIQ